MDDGEGGGGLSMSKEVKEEKPSKSESSPSQRIVFFLVGFLSGFFLFDVRRCEMQCVR